MFYIVIPKIACNKKKKIASYKDTYSISPKSPIQILMNYKFKGGDRVIDANADFKDFISISITNKDNELYLIGYDTYTHKKIFQKLNEFTGELVPVYIEGVENVSENHKIVKDNIQKVSNYVERYLFNLPQKERSETLLIEKLSSKFNIQKKYIQIILKILISRNIINIEFVKTQIYLKLSFITKEENENRKFLSSIIDELESKSKRIELLIKHGGTIGTYRENLLKSILQKYLPQKYHVATGFIEGSTKQIDIIIYDQLNYIPLFREDDLVVVKVEAVRAVIEVKSNLTNKTLKESLEALFDIQTYECPRVPYFKGIFSFNTKYRNSVSISNQIIKFYNTQDLKRYRDFKLKSLFEIVDCICVPKTHLLFSKHLLGYEKINKQLVPGIFYTDKKYNYDIESSLFLSRLFAYLDVENSFRKINRYYFNDLSKEFKPMFGGYIHGVDWRPTLGVFGEDIFSKEGAINRYDLVQKWFKGNLTTSQIHDYYDELIRKKFEK